jgi:fatty acid desaturase
MQPEISAQQAPVARRSSESEPARKKRQAPDSVEARDQDTEAPSSDAQRIAAFGRELDDLRREIEAELGKEDALHIQRIGALSRRFEIVGRSLLHFSFEPVGFGLGTFALWLHKCLELMEIGHMALHGAFDNLPGAERYQARGFRWKAPIDEASWHQVHNVRHHQHTNIVGRDPDINFGALRLSAHVPHQLAHALQPVTNVLTWFGFANAINLHVTGMLDVYLNPAEPEVLDDKKSATVRAAQRAYVRKFLRYYAREYLLFPLLAGPFFGKVLLGNMLSELGRDLWSGAIIYCGHVGVRDFPRGSQAEDRAHWYVMQVESARHVEVPRFVSILSGALDCQIEHHLFPRLPPNRLRQIAPRVREICEAHGVRYASDTWSGSLRTVLRELRRLASPRAEPAAPLAAHV